MRINKTKNQLKKIEFYDYRVKSLIRTFINKYKKKTPFK